MFSGRAAPLPRGAPRLRRLLQQVDRAGRGQPEHMGQPDPGALELPVPGLTAQVVTTSNRLATPVAPIGWPLESSPPEALSGVLPSRHGPPGEMKSPAPPGSHGPDLPGGGQVPPGELGSGAPGAGTLLATVREWTIRLPTARRSRWPPRSRPTCPTVCSATCSACLQVSGAVSAGQRDVDHDSDSCTPAQGIRDAMDAELIGTWRSGTASTPASARRWVGP